MMGSAAGGIGFTDGGVASYFAASTATALRGALLAVVDMTGGGCTFEVPMPPTSYVSRSNINIKLGDDYVPRDITHLAGWDFTSDAKTAVRLYGPLCDAARSGTASAVSVVFYCLIG